eukprot:UN20401
MGNFIFLLKSLLSLQIFASFSLKLRR